MPSTTSADGPGETELLAVELRVADAVGGLMEFWGFKRAMGRMWALLYLSPGPLPAAELGDRLTMSSGAVSTTLAELQKWGVVRRTWKPGDRRDWFEAETSVWRMVTRVFRERELTLVRGAAEVFAEAERALGRARARASAEEKARLKFQRERVGQLLALARLGEALLGAILSGKRIDPTPIRSFIGG